MTDLALPPETAFEIALYGDIDMARVPELRGLVDAYRASDATDVVIDLSEVDFMDSTGLGTMARLHREAKDRGGTVTIRNANPMVTRTFSIAGLGGILNLVDD